MEADWTYALKHLESNSCFGGCCTPNFTLTLNNLAIPVVEKVKYLGIFMNSRCNNVDPSATLRKIFGSFNNIMSVLGHGNDEPLAVHYIL